MTIRRRLAASKPRFDPCNLVPNGVANRAPWFEIGISVPPNRIPLFAHTGNLLSRHRCRDPLIGIVADYLDWTIRPRLAGSVSGEVLTDKRIVLPGWLHHFGSGQLGNCCRERAHLLDVVIECNPFFCQHVG
jgi:hypothetical protein